jgi:hypothetical protein
VGELDAGSDANLGVDRYRTRAGSYGIWLASSSNDFRKYYPEQEVEAYWQYWADDGSKNCYRSAGVPATLDSDQQDGLHCAEFESEVPKRVGADKSAVEAMIAGVADSSLP